VSAPFGGVPGEQPDLGALLQRLGRLISSGTQASVDWAGAERTALDELRRVNHPLVTDDDERAVVAAVGTAQVWLDEGCALPALTTVARAWTPTQWFTGTLPTWQQIIEPVAAQVSAGVTGLLSEQSGEAGALPGLPAEVSAQLGGVLGPLLAAMRPLAAVMFGAQVGQSLGRMSCDVLGGGDVGLALTADRVPTLVPFGIERFGAGLDVEPVQIVHYVALREAARERLFTAAPWFTARVRDAMAEYARGLQVDVDAIRDALSSIDPAHPETVREALGSGVFEPRATPSQQAVLSRIETLIALSEGWVDVAVEAAAATRLPALPRLAEAMRRRRATGGPAERAFSALVGLEIRPVRLREAARLWLLLGHARGASTRDGLWRHPDLMPSGADLAEPEAFIEHLPA